MVNNIAFLKSILMVGVCTIALSACESVDSAWDDMTGDGTPYAGDLQPQTQPQQMAMMQPPQMMAQPMMQPMAQPMPIMQQPQIMAADQSVIPQSALQPQMMAQPQMQPMQMQQQPMMAMAQQQPPILPISAASMQPNLANVPARPDASMLPTPQQVADARSELSQDNQMLTGVLRDPRAPQAPMAASQPQMQQPGMMTMAPMQPQSTLPMGIPQQVADSHQGKLMGLKATAPGRYTLVPMAPDNAMGSFALASSITAPQGSSQVTMPQYQELQRVAGQYNKMPGKVRVVTYSDPQNEPMAVQRASVAAAYLVDMGIPADAIRVKVEPSAAPSPIAKTDIFLQGNTAQQ